MKELAFSEDKILTLPKLTISFVKCTIKSVNDVEKELECSEIFQNDVPQPFAATPVKLTNILSAQILCDGNDVKTTIQMFISVQDLGFTYLPGDSIGILPENSESEVEILIKLLDLHDVADDILEITLDNNVVKKKLPPYIPECSTIRNLLGNYLDVRSIVKKSFIRALVEYTADLKEKRRLEELCCVEGSLEYKKYILEKATSLLDILKEFQSCKPPISLLIEHLPRLMPRAYSIASSPLLYPDVIRIVFNLVKDVRERNGVCTSWLYKKATKFLDLSTQFDNLSLTEHHMKTKIQIPIYLRKSSNFQIPQHPNWQKSSLIMIGPGTGVAPFIGFLEHRRKQVENGDVVKSDLNNILLFGCRHRDQDFIFKYDLEKYSNEKILTELMVCFSRDKDEGCKYVQHLFQKEKELLVNLLNKEDTYLFICGDALNMVKDVQEVIVNCISEVNGVSLDNSVTFFQSLEKNGTFIKDVWR